MRGLMNRGLGASLILMMALTAGCSSSIYGWNVRTYSSPPFPSFNEVVLGHEPVAIFGALAQPGLLGSEIGIDAILAQVVRKVAPNIKVIGLKETVTRINGKGLADEYTRMRMDALLTDMLSRDPLRKLGAAVGARYVFQPRLTAFTQTMTDRWSFVDVRIVQTRGSIMRMSLQLWDTETGELLWASLAETTVQSEAIAQDPVYFQDAARVTLGSIIADLLSGKTASTYGPLNQFIDQLIQIPQPETKVDGREAPKPDS